MIEDFSVTSLLLKHGPSLTSHLAAYIRKAGVSEDASRQRLSRLPKNVMILKGMSFPKRARFIYLANQFGTEEYWVNLRNVIKDNAPAYAAALAGVESRGGIVTRTHFDVVSGSPILQKNQISSTIALERLCAVKLLKKINLGEFGECVSLSDIFEGQKEFAQLRARILTENILLIAIKEWAGRMNLATSKGTAIRGEIEKTPQFATCCFDLCGPSYIRPLQRLKSTGVDPGFLVADVIMGHIMDKNAVSPFIRKCEMVSYFKKCRPFIPMLIAEEFTPEALHLCRSKGIMATNPKTLFGQTIADGLSDLLKVLGNAASMAAANPEKLESLFNSLGKIEGAATNLRGALFELVVGHLVLKIEDGSIDIGVNIECDGKKREIDVRLVKNRLLIFYECKGYQTTAFVKKAEVEEWINEKIPVIYKFHQLEKRFKDDKMKFEFWTCGEFDDEALILLTEASSKTKKYEIAWKNGSAISDYAKGVKESGIRNTLNEHYFKHPLKKV